MQFSLLTGDSEGIPRREHLEAAAKGGSVAARLELEEAEAADPGGAEYLWRWFLELHGGRTSNGFGVNPIGWLDIDAWSRVTGRKLVGWEFQAIRDLDRAFLQEYARANGERSKQRPRAT